MTLLLMPMAATTLASPEEVLREMVTREWAAIPWAQARPEVRGARAAEQLETAEQPGADSAREVELAQGATRAAAHQQVAAELILGQM
jgi:hypothetical protein